MIPKSAAANVITGFMWPPDTGFAARRRIATMNAIRIDITRFGALIFASIVEITMVSRAKTNTPVPTNSAKEALQT